MSVGARLISSFYCRLKFIGPQIILKYELFSYSVMFLFLFSTWMYWKWSTLIIDP